MKFEVRFRTNGYGNPVFLLDRSTGLDHVDKIREELELPNLPLDVMKPGINAIFSNIDSEITEKMARESGLFRDRGIVSVTTPKGSLNPFVYEIVSYTKGDNGCVILAEIKREIDTQAVLDAWKKAGYPTEWNPREEEEK